MKILLVTESYWPNADGGALFERRLVHGLIGLGNEVQVWAPSKNIHSYIEPDEDSQIHRERAITLLVNTKYKVSLWPFWHGRQLIKQLKPEVVHVHNAFAMGLTGLYVAKRRGIPVVATNHFMPENALLNLKGVKWLYGPLYKLIWAYLVWFHNKCQFVTSPTPTAVQLLVDHGLKSPAKAISNGIDDHIFRPGLDTTSVRAKYSLPDKPIILYVGRVDGEKRLDVLLDSLPAVLAVNPAHLVIAGFGKAMEALKAQAKRLGISQYITFTGFLDESDKPALYNVANVFAISSPAELQSIVTLEAMACARPIVAVNVAALSELCHDGQNGYLFPENDSTALTDRLLKILADPKLQERFGQESRRIIEQHHATEVTFREYQAVYHEVTRNSSHTSFRVQKPTVGRRRSRNLRKGSHSYTDER